MRTRFARLLMESTAIEIMRQGFEKTVKDGDVAELVAEIEAKEGKPLGKTLEEVEAIMTEVAEGKIELTQTSNICSAMEAMDRGWSLARSWHRRRGACLKPRRVLRSSRRTTPFTSQTHRRRLLDQRDSSSLRRCSSCSPSVPSTS